MQPILPLAPEFFHRSHPRAASGSSAERDALADYHIELRQQPKTLMAHDARKLGNPVFRRLSQRMGALPVHE